MTDKQIYLIIICLVVLAALAGVIISILKKKLAHEDMDDMEGLEFEHYCADLLSDNGFEDVEVTKGSGDFGADILAVKDGVTYAFQCKCYDKPIGVKAVQEIYAGRDYYGRMVGVVMTNQDFTQPAVTLADKLNIILWDRDRLTQMDELADE
jgi:restriction system protein